MRAEGRSLGEYWDCIKKGMTLLSARICIGKAGEFLRGNLHSLDKAGDLLRN
jgi:hypothetical protein